MIHRIIRKFKEVKAKIDSKIAIHDPINDLSNAYDDDTGGGGAASSGYAPPQQQAQIEEMGLMAMEADLNELESQNRAVKKVWTRNTLVSVHCKLLFVHSVSATYCRIQSLIK